MWGRSKGAGSSQKQSTGNGHSELVNGANGPSGSSSGAVVRAASHAGSWYTADASELEQQLTGWLEASEVDPDPSIRAIIAPHAGYRYSGHCAAYAFGHLDPSSTSRIFVLGPSHHHFTRKCMLTSADVYRTPLGDMPIDVETVQKLRETGLFEELPMDVDEAEHSLEMHLPYLVKRMEGHPFKLVPIVVGSLLPSTEGDYGRVLAPFLDDSSNFFSISSDFCHWGSRFSYTPFDRSLGAIHESIEALDKEGMGAIETGCCKPFTTYLRKTENTICGRHPISILLSTLEHSTLSHSVSFVRYEQSSKCTTMRDSSVSYASGIVVRNPGTDSKKRARKVVN